MAGPSGQIITAAYRPAPLAQLFHLKTTTAVNTAQRLATLITSSGGVMPVVVDEMFALSLGTPAGSSGLPPTRPPNHLFIQVPVASANPIYVTWDNNTAPVVGGPGMEVLPGGPPLKLENAGLSFLRPKAAGTYQVNALTSIQVIAVAATVVLLQFAD